ncbi:serine threonine protein kinase [Colletotrichum incanum]|uniref:Serine threonine protein kinase n=1 Tax=Colletotrichum incanum TaxID=1573173 RepID=A0A167BE01_COLIC|nr:serine threonine protein kinase [Colletotrichum incanum]
MATRLDSSKLYEDICVSYGIDKLHGHREKPKGWVFETFFAEGARRNITKRVLFSNSRKVFLVLVLLDLSWDIEKLLDAGLTDSDLPLVKDGHIFMSEFDNGRKFTLPEEWSSQMVDQFLDKQWRVLAPVFTASGEHRTFDSQYPLPFEKIRENHKFGGRSIVYHAQIRSSHRENPRTEPYSCEVILKEFMNRSKGDFEAERENLVSIRRLGNNKHITQYLETFSQGDRSYIIFPVAEGGDLEDFWETHSSQARNLRLALWCLEQMRGLAEGLQVLHNFLNNDANCRHGDLKPGNILHFLADGGDGTLKIADFGISRIHNEATFQRLDKPTTTRSTTPSYEAPEASSNKARSRKYDIWSMGCIFLEFTVWLVHGWEAVRQFSSARTSKTPRLGEDTSWAHFYQGTGATAVVHPEVFRTLARLKCVPQSARGTALGDLLDTVENHLLIVDFNARFNARDLSQRLGDIVSKARSDATYLFNCD